MKAQLALSIAAGFYLLSLGADFLPSRPGRAIWLLGPVALTANALAVALRYWSAWPMLPMYLGAVALPLGLGLSALWPVSAGGAGRARRYLLAAATLVALAAVIFPKDFYLPFIRSRSLWAHLFFWCQTAGKSCFLVAAAWALVDLVPAKKPARENGTRPLNRMLSWTIWGFCFWTISMFCGELWSYLGWGTPVVWDDPAITTIMATWFFYVGGLHLHLAGAWAVRIRNVYCAAGALVVFCFNILPDLGPLRWPF